MVSLGQGTPPHSLSTEHSPRWCSTDSGLPTVAPSPQDVGRLCLCTAAPYHRHHHHRRSSVSLGSTLLGSTRFYSVLLSSTRFYSVLLTVRMILSARRLSTECHAAAPTSQSYCLTAARALYRPASPPISAERTPTLDQSAGEEAPCSTCAQLGRIRVKGRNSATAAATAEAARRRRRPRRRGGGGGGGGGGGDR